MTFGLGWLSYLGIFREAICFFRLTLGVVSHTSGCVQETLVLVTGMDARVASAFIDLVRETHKMQVATCRRMSKSAKKCFEKLEKEL